MCKIKKFEEDKKEIEKLTFTAEGVCFWGLRKVRLRKVESGPNP